MTARSRRSSFHVAPAFEICDVGMRVGWGELYQMFENLYHRDSINSDSLLSFKSAVEYWNNYKLPSAVSRVSWHAPACLSLCVFSLPGSPYDFISLEWLQKWLDESTPPKPIDNTACLCSHGKLHPDKIPIMKRISEYVADFFYRRYGGGPRLNGEVSGEQMPSPSHVLICWVWLEPCSGPCSILSQLFSFTTSFPRVAFVLHCYFRLILLILLNYVSVQTNKVSLIAGSVS